MKRTIENSIRGNLAFVYIIIAIVCVVTVTYAYKLRDKIGIQRQNIEHYHHQLSQTNDLIFTVQQAQSSANRYVVTKKLAYLRESQRLAKEVELKIDSLKTQNIQPLFSDTLHTINQLLVKKQDIARDLIRLFARTDLLQELKEKIDQAEPVVSETPLIVTTTKLDTVIQTVPQKGFWKRLGAVFAPGKSEPETKVDIVTTKVDTIKSFTVDSLEILSDVRAMSEQASVAYFKRLTAIEKQVSTLLASDQEISMQISELLLQLHRQTIDAVLEEIQKSEAQIDQTYDYLIVASAFALVLIMLFVYLIINDVNKGLAARKALEEAKKKTEEIMESRHKLLLSVSHDIKAPLSSMLGHLDLFSEQHLSASENKRVASMQHSGKHILALLSNLLEFSKLEKGVLQTECSTFDTMELCQEINDMFAPLCEQKQLPFIFRADVAELRYISSDYLKIKQILINVISNAIKYTLHGSVTFSVTEENSRLIIAVTDTGIGIAPDKLKQLFKPFVRIGNHQSHIEGSGFGMYLVKGLTDLLRGKIEVASAAEKGTTVTISIPVEKSGPALLGAGNEKPTEHKPLELPTKIIVVDDDPSMLVLIKEMARKIGCEVTACSNIDEFTELYSAQFNLVITDMEMGMISGRDILSMVRHSESKTPVVVMTAMGKFDVATAEAEGFDGYLQKPFSINGLKDLIAGKSSHPPVEAKSPNHPFPRLHEMFDGDMEAITEVLNSFAVASEKNLLLLNEAVINDQFAAAQAICHKMLPMFIQLGLDEQVPFLQKMDGLRGKSPDEFPEWKSETSACIVSAETIVSQMKLKSDAV